MDAHKLFELDDDNDVLRVVYIEREKVLHNIFLFQMLIPDYTRVFIVH
mgnify:FL=1